MPIKSSSCTTGTSWRPGAMTISSPAAALTTGSFATSLNSKTTMPSPSPDSPAQAAGPLAVSLPPPAEWSDEVREIMNRPPPWLLRSGTGLLAGAVLVLFSIAWFIRYPDMITARVTLTGSVPVAEVVARQSGHLASLRVSEKQTVKKDEILAIVRSPADADAVLALDADLKRLAPAITGDESTLKAEFPKHHNLGQIQPGYTAFLSAWRSFHTILADDYAKKA